MDKRKKNETTRMVRKMDFGLGGMRMDKREEEETTRMVRKMDFGLGGMRMKMSQRLKLTVTVS